MEIKATGRADGAGFRVRAALAAWALLIVVVCVRGLLQPQDHNCYANFYEPAGRLWLAGQDPYLGTGGAYRYGPPVSVCLAPLTLAPVWLSSLLWRLINAAAFLGALVWWLRACAPPTWSPTLRAVLLLAVIPLSVGNINSGQANPLLLGLLLATTAAAARERWNLAAVFCAGACLLKLYPVALALLLIGAYPRRFAPRFLLALAAGLLLPFVFQRPEHVVRQYSDWWAVLLNDDRTQGSLVDIAYRDLWLLIRNLHLPISHSVYVVIQLLTAGLIGATCLAGRWLAGWKPAETANAAFHLGVCWMTLCGPATEAATYMLVAPTLAWAVLQSWHRSCSVWTQGLLLASAAVFWAALLGCLSSHTAVWTACGFHPLGALLLFIALGAEYVRRLSAPEPVAREETSSRARAA